MDSNKALACAIAPALRMLYSSDGLATVGFYPGGDVFASLGAEHDSDGPVVVEPMLIEPNADIASEFSAFVSAKGRAPDIVVVRGLGGFKISKSRKIGAGGRLAGKIAIVTGGAQGFGKGIAEAMAAEGAFVAVADLNLEGALVCSAELNRRFGSDTAIAVQVDVSDEASVEHMVQETILSFGGLDVLVSNAGILVAGSLSDLSKDSFDLVRKFYESKVPLGRGCTIADVVRAILYVVEQEYETGQAIPVTGGQVMLR